VSLANITKQGEIQSFSKWAFEQFLISSGVFPFRHGARPVSTETQTHCGCTKIQFFGGNTPQSLFVNGRDGACPVSLANINKQGGKYIL